jgi:hypothetical protein
MPGSAGLRQLKNIQNDYYFGACFQAVLIIALSAAPEVCM